jgi:Protein of unknown function (DUF3489)
MSVKLTDAQLMMLRAAADREDLCLSAPDKMKGAILTKISEKLVKLGLVREIRAKAGMPVWRRDDAGQTYAFKLTKVALRAIAVDEGSEEPIATSKASDARGPHVIGEHAKTLRPRTGSKLAQVIDLLQRSHGATIHNLMEATGWLPHTTRATLTGLRKRGYKIALDRSEGKRDSIYRIESESTAPERGPADVVPEAP